MKTIFVLAVLVFASAPAFARDSSHLVCTGYMAPGDIGPDNYGLAIHFDEYRDGENRREQLSAIWAANLYGGSRINTGDEFGQNGSVIMSQKENAKAIFYQGTYNVSKDNNGNYLLKLKGKLNLDPATDSTAQSISTTLQCVDISN